MQDETPTHNHPCCCRMSAEMAAERGDETFGIVPKLQV
jgi:hypothetical protein